MNFLQNPFLLLEKEINAGGVDYVPPMVCLLPACASAIVPAYVERTGKAVTNESNEIGSVGHPYENTPILSLELTS